MLPMTRRTRSNRPLNEQDVARAIGAFARLSRSAQIALVALIAVAAVVGIVLYQRGHFRADPTPADPQPTATSLPAPTTGPTTRRVPMTPERVAEIVAGHDLGDPLTLGNPSNASSDRNNYLINRPVYAVSWNDELGIPNWVSWRTVKSNFGDGKRAPGFEPDPGLPKGFRKVYHDDYSGSGFDRGHMCPNADRDATTELASLTFFTSNIIAQAANVNQKAWERLESYARLIVSRDRLRLYTVAGGIGQGGEGLNGPRDWTKEKGVAVPAECWKVIVAIPDYVGPDDPARITASARVIAVLMPNRQSGVGENWSAFRVTPAEIERRTGYRFFTNLRPEVAEALRNKLDNEPIMQPPNPYRQPRPGKNPSR